MTGRTQHTSIVLTHWNAGVFHRDMLPLLIPELIIYALLYDEVLIREEDLITNRQITTLLSDPHNYSIFEELLTTGLVKLLRLPSDLYPAGRQFDPERLPISARAEEHEKRRSYKGKPWRATQREARLFRSLDQVVTRSQLASRFHVAFPADNPFASRLADILEQREEYELSIHPSFRYLDPRAADAFIAFCREADDWQRFVRDRGIASPITGPDSRFYRSAAYQCARFFPGKRAMLRLVESVYAATYCDREGSDGRYGGGDLVELPYRFDSAAEKEAARAAIVRAEIVPTKGALLLAVEQGISEVLVRTRASRAFSELLAAIKMLGSVPESGLPSEALFRDAWWNLAEEYAQHWARVMLRPSRTLKRIMHCLAWLYVGIRMKGFLVVPGWPSSGLDLAVAEDALIGHVAIQRLAPSLLTAVRGLGTMPAIRGSLAGAVSIRCSTVPTEQGDAARDETPEVVSCGKT